MIDKNTEITLEKVKRLIKTYSDYRFSLIEELDTLMFVPDKTYRSVPDETKNWKPVAKGETWGDDGVGYAWFSANYKVTADLKGKDIWLVSNAGASEALLFINGKPSGMFDYTPDLFKLNERTHVIQPLIYGANEGQEINVAIEAYGGHDDRGCAPLQNYLVNEFYPINRKRVFNGLYIALNDNLVNSFIYELNTVFQLYENLPDSSDIKWQACRILYSIFPLVPQIPDEVPEDEWRQGICKSREILSQILKKQPKDEESSAKYGLIGHSHLDTAWRWDIEETKHKAARTFSNALRIMEEDKEYTFFQSTVLYLDWMKKYYPDIYDGIKCRVKEGRWEPNGGSWVESDGNIPGGEYLIRQFVRGQKYLAENFDYRADCYWLPDTFGYSPAIPQIMLGCGLKYFLTTKLSWNECNTFPYDTFIWQGIDGSKVLTHFNVIHCYPDAETMLNQKISKPELCNKKLIAYGFGDGGGGPARDMVAYSHIVNNIDGIPKSEHTTVSRFMQNIEKEHKELPIYDGELYLEAHRGTLTQMHDIKRSNRKAEIAIHDLELISVHKNISDGTAADAKLGEMLDTLLLNQFHDILPGTTLESVHDLAIKQNYDIVEKSVSKIKDLIGGKEKDKISVYNTLSFKRDDLLVLDGEVEIKDKLCQTYSDINGDIKTAVLISLEPLCATTISIGNALTAQSPFKAENNTLETPYYSVSFNENGEICKLFDKECGRDINDSGKYALNSFLFGEDVPLFWDNWDINYDQKLKMKHSATLLSEEVVSNGALEYRIRRKYSLGKASLVIQDNIFYANSRRIDFETQIDWQEKHSLLKAVFPVNIKSQFVKNETQFGYVTRVNNENTSYDSTKFEVCNHKWSDMSENRYGVAILNDCKYGISVNGNVMSLTLHRGGCSPDSRGDAGIHKFTYSLLPHNGGFSFDNVIKDAYELNYEPLKSYGISKGLDIPMFLVDAPNVLIETVKTAEDNNGYVVRLYESECNLTNINLKVNFDYVSVCETNMLEEEIEQLESKDGVISLKIKPFEIKTLKFLTEGCS